MYDIDFELLMNESFIQSLCNKCLQCRYAEQVIIENNKVFLKSLNQELTEVSLKDSRIFLDIKHIFVAYKIYYSNPNLDTYSLFYPSQYMLDLINHHGVQVTYVIALTKLMIENKAPYPSFSFTQNI